MSGRLQGKLIHFSSQRISEQSTGEGLCKDVSEASGSLNLGNFLIGQTTSYISKNDTPYVMAKRITDPLRI
jgi:hypothetical protein